MKSSDENICRVTGPLWWRIHRSPVDYPHKGQWRGTLMFSLICPWTNGSANNRDAGDFRISWWRHQMEAFAALLDLFEGNPPVTGGLPLQRPMTQSLDVFFDLPLNKRLSKQSRRRWFSDIMMASSNGSIRVTGPLWGESTSHRWIPLTKANDAELWYFLWSTPEQMVEQTIAGDLIRQLCSLWRHYNTWFGSVCYCMKSSLNTASVINIH